MAEPLTSQVWVAAWLQKAGHDLIDLLTRCADSDVRFADWADRISELSAFGTVLRYPSVDADPTVSDVTHALQTARLFHGFVSSIIVDQRLTP